jgi:hypothetical protein
MGTDTVVVRMRPFVAVTLARMGFRMFRMEGVPTALDVDGGLALGFGSAGVSSRR